LSRTDAWDWFSNHMAATLVALLTAHLLGDLILPLKRRRRTRFLALHVVSVTLASYLLLGAFHWPVLLVVLLAHFGVGLLEKNITASVASFLATQFAYLAVLLTLTFIFPDAAKDGWWITRITPDRSRWYFAILSLISGTILCVPTGGRLIAILTKGFSDEIDNNGMEGLKKGGQYIGWLERLLVLLLLLMDQPNGIGFLFAAKSILRFGEIKDASQRRIAEYIIIGTFLSFGWALLISGITQKAFKYWIR